MVGFQFIDDGTVRSIGAILLTAIALFVGTGYIALDTVYSWTGRFADSSTNADDNPNIGLYVLYLLLPLVLLFLFFVLETILVLRVLGERRPMSKFDGSWASTPANGTCSISAGRSGQLCTRSNIPIHHQQASLQLDIRQN